jgi:hypothetical protein
MHVQYSLHVCQSDAVDHFRTDMFVFLWCDGCFGNMWLVSFAFVQTGTDDFQLLSIRLALRLYLWKRVVLDFRIGVPM